jgi:tRNA (guanine9-N1)-methyltransferase
MDDDAKEKQIPSSLAQPRAKLSRKHVPVVLPGPRLIMDMSWGSLMSEHTQRKVISQVSMAYSFNKQSQKALPMIFTSVDEQWRGLLQRVDAFHWKAEIVTITQQSFLEAVPLTELVYLTADTTNVLTTVDPTKAYIIGCLIDHNSKKGVTRDFAVEHGIRMERLPIQEFITMDGRVVLTINHVTELLVRVANGLDWKTALLQTIPQRKNPREKPEAKPASEPGPKPEPSSGWCNVW